MERQSPQPSSRNSVAQSQPGTLDLLGFTHYWCLSHRGSWVVKRKTARDRFSRALKKIGDWCRQNLHRPVAEQCRTLGQKLRGHFGYYGITGNMDALKRFVCLAIRVWYRWLARRQRKGYFSWAAFRELLRRFPLPRATVMQSVYRSVANP